ncbi:MAG: pyridoxal phosphate-dependent aminotransferase [Planctomycetota bacterium]|jgi:histidinol-phosphate aminotransferase
MTPFPRSDYSLLNPYDPGRTPVDLDLSDNTNLWGVHPAALKAVRTVSGESLTRYPSVYANDLKAAVARKFGVPEENVTTGCGSDDILDSAFRASTIPPGRISYPNPTFSMVEAFSRMNGLDPLTVPWSKAEVDPGHLLLEEPDLVYICRPNNPTGASVSREWVLGLLALGGPDGPLVALDEAYADFTDDSFIQNACESDRLLVLRTLSKIYRLAGLRVGFGVGPRNVIEEVEKSRGPYKVNQAAEAAAIAALEDESGWEEEIRGKVMENREKLANELLARGLQPLPSDANFLLVSVGPASAIEVNRALKELGVLVRPFPDLDEVGDAIRVTIGPWEFMEHFLLALDQLMTSESQE